MNYGEWIPVEERLPEECEEYLVSRKSPITGEYKVYEDMYITCDDRFIMDGVIAWMPLPEPYKPE